MSEDSSVSKKRGRPQIHSRRDPYQNIGRGVPLRSQARQLVSRVRDYFDREKSNNGPLLPVGQVVDRTCAALNIGKNTVVKICKEKRRHEESGSKMVTPRKKRCIAKRVTKLDAFQKDAIRRHVYSYFTRKEYPTIKKCHVTLKEADLFKGSKTSLRTVLKRLGFTYQQFGNRKVLMERGDIVAWRCRFLREIKKENFSDLVWIDETWVNTSHSLKKGWTDNSIQGTMGIPIGKGGRLILLHAGRADGFLPNCQLLFTSKKTSDYHEEMNHLTFKKWFTEALIPNLDKPSVIVMDNAKYHSKILDKPPTMASRKPEIVEWLRMHRVSFEDDMKKSELLELVFQNRPRFPKYEIDDIAQKNGHKIIRLPPYHCHFNAIELIWAQIKGYVARNNKSFNITEVKRLTEEGISSINASDWKKVVEHTKKTILEAWENEGLVENAVEELVININGSDSESDDEWNSESEEQHMVDDEDMDITCQISGYGSDVEDNVSDSGSDISGVFPHSPVQENVLRFSEF